MRQLQTADTKKPKPNGADEPNAKELYEMIAKAAYYRAEKRGFASGFEADDWAAAEAEVKQRLRDGTPRGR
jgi:hypothetical protein